MSKLPKGLRKLIIFLIIIGILYFLYRLFFVGITKKQRYQKCAHTCEELMLLESSIPVCKRKCIEISGYNPEATPGPKKSKTEIKEASQKEYACNYVWPQQVIEKDTQAITKICPLEKPYCNKEDGKYENVKCCRWENEKYFDCVSLDSLLKGK